MKNKELKIAFYDACSYDKESFSEGKELSIQY